MKMRGSWAWVVKFAGVTVLVSGLLLLTAFLGSGKRSHQTDVKSSGTAASGASRLTGGNGNPRWTEAYGKLPLSFEENQGQTARDVRYVSHGSGYELFLTPREAVLALRPNAPRDLSPLRRTARLRALREARRAGQTTAIRMRLEGANSEPRIFGTDRLPTKVNYFIGNDPKKWHTDVPSYARVEYAGIYPGVDLVFYGNQRRLEYDFVVAPGADPAAIAWKVDGARRMRINSRGDVVLGVSGGEVELRKPAVYQNVNGERREIAGGYAIGRDRLVRFVIGSYDRSEPLILDPVLNYSTYLGGGSDDAGFAIAVDPSGNAFIAGQTLSTTFPAGTHVGFGTAPSPNLGASFVAELNPAGTQLLYSSYLAGSITNAFESASGIAVDSTGKIYVTGGTFASDFPTSSTIAGFRPGPNPSNVNGTSYIVKLDPALSGNGSLLYSSYIGGTNGTGLFGGDFGQAIAVDANEIAYVAGYTDSTASTTITSLPNFPVVNGFQPTLNNPNGNAFLAKIDTKVAGTASLVYSTYLGGAGVNACALCRLLYGEDAFGVAIDTAGNAYLAGTTTSTDFPTKNGFQNTAPAGNIQGTVFVTQIDTTKPVATQLVYSTYLGGAVFDQANAIALEPNSKVAYVTGTTESLTIPAMPAGAFQPTGKAGGTAFIGLIDAAQPPAKSLKYYTFLGGTNGAIGYGIKADAQGNAYVGGTTSSTDFPFPPKASVTGGFEPTYPAGAPSAGFISKLNPAGGGTTDLLYSTFFGGVGTAANGEHIFAIAIDSSSPANVYVTGQAYSTAATFPVFPTAAPTAFQPALNGTSDAFVAKLTLIPTLAVAPAPGTTLDFGTVQTGIKSAAQTVTLTNNTNGPIAFASAVLSGTNAADYAVSTAGCSPNIVVGTPCVVSITFTPMVVAPPSEVATLTITDGDSTSPQVFNLTGKGTNMPADFTLGATPTTLTVAQGAVGAPITITVNPVNGFNAAVALTCTGTPAKSSCVLNPASITAPTTATLTFTAHALFLPLPVSKPAPPFNMLRIVPLLVALMLLFLLRSTQRFRTRLAMVSVIFICATLAACSGPGAPPSNNNTAKGMYTLTITGTSGALTHNVPVTVTVN